jgi:hypothetical protein
MGLVLWRGASSTWLVPTLCAFLHPHSRLPARPMIEESLGATLIRHRSVTDSRNAGPPREWAVGDKTRRGAARPWRPERRHLVAPPSGCHGRRAGMSRVLANHWLSRVRRGDATCLLTMQTRHAHHGHEPHGGPVDRLLHGVAPHSVNSRESDRLRGRAQPQSQSVPPSQ